MPIGCVPVAAEWPAPQQVPPARGPGQRVRVHRGRPLELLAS